MNRGLRTAASLLWALLLAVLAPGALHAQGVTTGAISGTVTDENGQGITGIQIVATNRSTGQTARTVTRDGGRYSVQGLEVGGPYSVSASGLGRAAQTQQGFSLALGQNLRVDFQLGTQAVALEGLTVEAEANPLLSPSNKGAATLISDSAVARLPTLNRNFTDFVKLAPQVSNPSSGGLSGGGVNGRFNNIQIDGASENDLFGLGSTGQPGGQARGKSIAVESVKEYQVLLSPFDVRQGNFAGLLVNAVTKSGTNDFDGSLYYYTRNEGLARSQPYIADFEQTQYGFSLGGPIIRDRLHFFINPEIQARTTPVSGPYLGQPASSQTPLPVSQADVESFQQILQGYGIEAGTAAQDENTNPLRNFFGRIDLQLPEWGSRLVLRHNYGRAEDDNFSRESTSSTPVFTLGSNAYYFESTKNSTVGQFFTTWGSGASNELFVGYNTIRDRRTPESLAPQITVNVRNPNGGFAQLRAGAEQFSQDNELDQDVFEVTDNFSFPLGAHTLTIGSKNEFYTIRNLFAESSYGVYTFLSLDSLRNGLVDTYRVAAPLRAGETEIPAAEFKAAQFSLYLQDNWQPSDRFSMTAGLRADIPVLRDEPLYTPVVDSIYGRRTDQVPSGQIQWSPRVGFNWDVTGDARNQLRGGVGVYVGRPPFVLLGNAFQNDGSGLGILNCSTSSSAPGRAPGFVANIEEQPTSCANGQGLANGVVGPVNLLDEDLKFPSTFRASLGFDRELPFGIVGSLEALYTRGIEGFFYIDRNLVGPQGTDARGRVLYGTIATSGVSSANVISRRFSEVVDVVNQGEDYAYNLTAGLQKRFDEGFEGRVSYTYSRARDVISATSSRAISNYRFGRTLSGLHTDRNTGISSFDLPHKIVAAGTYTFPWERFATSLSLIYTGQSGEPFTYVYGGSGGRGDLNADGLQGNDPIYIPTSATDGTQIQFRDIAASGGNPAITAADQAAAFERYINDNECLDEQRGKIMQRNTCRNGWTNFLDLSLRQSVPTIRGQSFSFEVGVFNFLNLLNEDWGQNRTFSGLSTRNLLTHVGQSTANAQTAQGIYQFTPNTRAFDTQGLSSNYQIQLSVRYAF